jgi:hypothetical protein
MRGSEHSFIKIGTTPFSIERRSLGSDLVGSHRLYGESSGHAFQPDS